MKTKKGVSEIISYVLLIAITIGVSISVYTWLKYQIPSCDESDINCFTPVDCPDGTSIVIDNYICNHKGIAINLLNNGRFNITGVIVAVTDDSNQIPDSYLTPIGSMSPKFGEYIFPEPLRPGDYKYVNFSSITRYNQAITQVQKIKMQVFINDGTRKLCKNVVIKENFQNCIIPLN